MAWKTTHPNYSPPKGAGWGGPAKGASRTKGLVAEFQPMSNDPEIKARQAAKAEQVRERIFELAMSADRQETQLAASVAYLNRVEGAPMQRQLVANVSDPSKLTDADLAAIAAGGGPAAPAPSDDPAGPGGVVH